MSEGSRRSCARASPAIHVDAVGARQVQRASPKTKGKFMTLLALMLLLLSGPPKEIDTSGVAAIFGRFSMGHGCPIGPDTMYTAAHVVSPAPFSDFGTPPVRWSMKGSAGIAYVQEIDPSADLALLKSVQAFPKWYKIAEDPPKVEDRVAVVGYDFSRPSKAFMDKIFLFKVTWVVAGHLLYDGSGEAGSSGSCVLNENDEVVGINIGYTIMNNLKKAGMGVGLWKPEKQS